MIQLVDVAQKKREAIKEQYKSLIYPVFFPPHPTQPDIIQFFASLLRVCGMEDRGWDPYAESRSVLEDLNALMEIKLPTNKFKRRELTSWRLGLLFYSHVVEMSAPYEVLANLLRFRLGKGYHPDPFQAYLTVKERKRASRTGLVPKKKIEIIKALASDAGLGVGAIFNEFFRNDFRNAISHSDFIFTDDGFRSRNGYGTESFSLTYEEVDDLIGKAKVFISTFFSLESDARRTWGQHAGKAIPYDPQLKGLMEILVDNDKLMNGFKVHWPNGLDSTYLRNEDGVEMTNCALAVDDNIINLMVGEYVQNPGTFSPLVATEEKPRYTPLQNGLATVWLL